jgi:hypothetical protein
MEKESSYTIVVAIPHPEEKGKKKWLTYHSPDLLNFQRFLDRDWADWLFFNVKDKAGQTLASFTKNNRCLVKRISS